LFKFDSIRLIDKKKGCGGRIENALTGVIRSPNFPNPLDSRRSCVWIISAEPGSRVQVKVLHFKLKKDAQNKCLDEFLMRPAPVALSREGIRSLNEGRHCDLRVGETFTSDHHMLNLYLTTDGLGANEGFEIAYDATQEASKWLVCLSQPLRSMSLSHLFLSLFR
jgi:hypothetical protein